MSTPPPMYEAPRFEGPYHGPSQAHSALQKRPRSKAAIGCLGCLGLLVVGFVFLVIIGIIGALVAPESTGSATEASPSAAPSQAGSAAPTESSSDETSAEPTTEPTRIGPTGSTQTVAPIDDSDAPEVAAALSTLESLDVKGRAPQTGYGRNQFGPTWEDVDGNGCSTRNDVLDRDLTQVEKASNDCAVESGTLDDPYTDTIIDFTAGPETSDDVHIDHVVALSDAWQKGAQQISAEDRLAFANDPLNLLAVDGPTNQSKGDGDAATWLPPNRDYWCPYVSRQVDVKAKYDLWVTQPEYNRIKEILEDCDEQPAPETTTPEPSPEPTPEPTEEQEPPAAADDRDGDGIVGEGTDRERSVDPAPIPDRAPAPEPVPERAPVDPEPEPAAPEVTYPNCTAAKQAGAAPLYKGGPGYAPKLDRDGDGVACES